MNRFQWSTIKFINFHIRKQSSKFTHIGGLFVFDSMYSISHPYCSTCLTRDQFRACVPTTITTLQAMDNHSHELHWCKGGKMAAKHTEHDWGRLITSREKSGWIILHFSLSTHVGFHCLTWFYKRNATDVLPSNVLRLLTMTSYDHKYVSDHRHISCLPECLF